MKRTTNETIISVLHAALIVYITECREVDDADGEMYARQAQAWLDELSQVQYSHRNGEEDEPNCPGCGAELDWIDCVQCTRVDWMTGVSCLACDNEGGWYHCQPCREAYTLKRLEWEHERELNQREE